jgi:alcohol/geraniol dehydrogenase (NADP+)
MKISAQAAAAAKSPLIPHTFEAAELSPHGVELEIECCGICYSDIHLIDDDWKKSVYPLVPGHEVVGRVVRVGSLVTHLAPGDRAGVGWQRSACLECDLCVAGLENLCPTQEATCVAHPGGFADRILTDARFAFAIPAGLDSRAAAPLLCGGVTVYSPMRRFGIDATRSVGVIGIGGLGHMAVAIARALGAEVTAFSSSASKRDEAIAMGAHRFASSTDVREIRKLSGTFDLLISTVDVRLDWVGFLGTLRPNGVLCLVGIPAGFIQIPPAALLGQRSIVTSEIGSRSAIRELLRLAARHRIAPRIQTAPLAEAQAAIERLRRNEVRYRMVLTM